MAKSYPAFFCFLYLPPSDRVESLSHSLSPSFRSQVGSAPRFAGCCGRHDYFLLVERGFLAAVYDSFYLTRFFFVFVHVPGPRLFPNPAWGQERSRLFLIAACPRAFWITPPPPPPILRSPLLKMIINSFLIAPSLKTSSFLPHTPVKGRGFSPACD